MSPKSNWLAPGMTPGHRLTAMLSLSLALLGFGRNASAAEATLSNGGATMEVLGIGNAALLGGDLTDPEDDGSGGRRQ